MKKLTKFCAISTIGMLFLSTLSSCASQQTPDVNEKVEDKLDFGKLVGDYYLDVSKNFNSTVVTTSSNDKYSQEISIIVEMDGDTQADKFLAKKTKHKKIGDFAKSNTGIALSNKMVTAQASLAKSLLKANYISSVKGNYTVLMNGFAATTTYSNVEKIRNFPGVKEVMISQTYDMPTVQSKANATNNHSGCDDENGLYKNDTIYQGEGMFVAVLDSGLDYNHQAFKGSVSAPRVSKNDIKNLLSNEEMSCETVNAKGTLSVDDVYISSKVPFAYDYADKDSDVLPAESDHGTHVAGIIVGEEEDTFSGVAPEAQLAFMKVFPDEEEKAPSDVIILALEDSALLGVDVINESLGSVGGFSYEYGVSDENERIEEKINAIYEKLTDLGISLVVSAGNDYYQSYTAVDGTNRIESPESNTIGSPGSYTTSFTVASVESEKTPYLLADDTTPITFTEASDNKSNEKDFIEDIFAIWNRRNPTDQKDVENDVLELEYVVVPGLGTDDDFKKVNVRDKIAVIERGVLTFEAKIASALTAGATAVLIYNNTSGLIRMTCGDSVKLPAASITNKLGLKLKEKGSGKLKVSKELKAGPFMSDFSSVGPNPDLTLKPEITSCGGDVLSAVIGGRYEEFSGTSMSAPNTSGIVLALRQYIQANWTKLTGKSVEEMSNVEITKLSQQLLMSTAVQCNNEDDNPYSPRKQGAGMASLQNAINATTYLHVGDSDKVKLELGDDKTKTGVYELKFNIKNIGDTPSTYDLITTTMSESITFGDKGINTISNDSYILNPNVSIKASANVTVNGNKVTVPAGEDGEITVTINLSAADRTHLDQFPNGMYVDGFVNLYSQDANGVDLSIPFLAFYGDWLKAPIWDLTYYDIQCPELYDEDIKEVDRIHPALNAVTPYGHYGDFYMIPLGGYVYSIDKNKNEQILATEDKAAISLYEEAIHSFYMVNGGLLRAPKKLTFTISDAVSGEVYMEKVTYNVRKDTFYQGSGSVLGYSDDHTFSALQNSIANNTKLLVTLDAELDYEGGDKLEHGKIQFSFYVDYEAPTLENVEYFKELNEKTGEYNYYIEVDLSDNRYVMSYSPCIIEENKSANATNPYKLSSLAPNTPVYQNEAGETTHVRIDITKYIDSIVNSATPDQFYLYVDDYAMNSSLYYIPLNGSDYKDLSVTQDEIVISENEVISVNDYVNLENAMLEGFTWTTNSKSVAVKNGEIVGLTRGTATLYGSSPSFKTTLKLKIKVLGANDAGYVKIDKAVPEDIEIESYEVVYMFNDDSQPSSIGEVGTKHYDFSKTIKLYPGEQIKLNTIVSPWYVDLEDYSLEWKYGSPVDIDDATGILTASSSGTDAIYVYLCKDGKKTKIKDSFKVEVQESYIYSGSFFQNYKGAEEVVALSESMNLKYIGEYAFSLCQYYLDSEEEIARKPYGNEFIKSIILPKDIETIYGYAFAKLSNLVSINIPSETKELYQGAFLDDKNLETVSIPEDSHLGKILFDAFRNCTSLKEINLKNVVSIGSYAFSGCTSLTSVDLSNSRYYGYHIFDGCTSLKNVILSKDTAIGDYMFANTGLETITLDQPYIGKGAFQNCKSLTSVTFTNPNVVISKDAFKGCTSLSNVTFAANSNVTIKNGAFTNTGITSITLPNGLVTLGDKVFYNSSLTEMKVSPNTELEVVNGAPLIGANRLTSITLNGESTFYSVKDGVLYSKDGSILVLAPITKTISSFAGVKEIAPGALGGNTTEAIVLPSTFEKLGAYALKESLVTSIDFSSSNAELCEYSFANTPNLQTISNYVFNKLSSNIFNGSSIVEVSFAEGAIIDSYALSNMTSLKKITIKSNTVIKDYAFYKSFSTLGGIVDLEGATNVTIGDYAFAESNVKTIDLSNVKSIGKGAFQGAKLLDTINVSNAESIGSHAFYGCENVNSITFSNTLTSIPAYAFYGISKVKTVNIPNVKIINEFAFAKMTSLETIDLSNVNSIKDQAFDGDSALQTVTLSSLETLGTSVFISCKALNNVTLPNTLTTLPDGTFYDCDALDTITMDHVNVIGAKAFYDCNKLTAITLPNVEEIKEGAFQNSALLSISLPKCKVIDIFAFSGTSISSIDMPKVESIESYAFTSTKLTTVELPNTLKKINACAFYMNKNLISFTNGGKDTVKANGWALDKGVLYTENLDKTYNLECYPIMKADKEYRIIDNTTRVQEYAFTYNELLEKVTFPTSLKTIGDSAFYSCSKLATYEFLSKQAPTLEGYYNSNLVNYIKQLKEDNFPPVLKDMYSNSYWTVYYYYNNFYDYVGLNEDIELTIIYDNDAKGYDTFIYDKFFAKKQIKKVVFAEFTVTFDTDGGSNISPLKVTEDTCATAPSNPTKEGYNFVKWVDSEGNDFSFSTPITGDITLKAIWEIIPSIDPEPEPEPEKKGCKGSIIAISSLTASLGLLGTGLIIYKKKKESER